MALCGGCRKREPLPVCPVEEQPPYHAAACITHVLAHIQRMY